MILVIGDTMIDIHLFGEVERISPEAPVPVVLQKTKSFSLGAAGYVAAQIAAIDGSCLLAHKSYLEPDGGNTHNRLKRLCQKHNVRTIPLQIDKVSEVITKERIWTGTQQICRIDVEDTSEPSREEEEEWFGKICDTIRQENVSCVVFSDYNKGTLTDTFIQDIATLCKKKDIPTILDPKRHTFIHLRDLGVIKPNNREILSTRKNAFHCSGLLGNTYLLNTAGKNGMRLYKNGDHIKSVKAIASHRQVVDVCGAGDITNAIVGYCLSKGKSVEEAMDSANKAAFHAVQHKGCYVLNKEEIKECLNGE